MARNNYGCFVKDCERETAARWSGEPVCNRHWQRLHKHGQTENPPRVIAPWKVCDVDGCDKKARTRSGKWCEMHYYRLYLHDNLEGSGWTPQEKLKHSHGYVIVRRPGHPLCRGSKSHVYEHRAVYYDAYGAGPFGCHWCGEVVTWDTLHIDHLDDDKTHNEIENLVPSCPGCNVSRGHDKMKRVTRERMSPLITADGITMTRRDWADMMGIKSSTLANRIAKGWTPEAAINTPTRPWRSSPLA